MMGAIVYAQDCPKITIDPATKQVYVVACNTGSTLSSGTISSGVVNTLTTTGLILSWVQKQYTETPKKLGSFTRISGKNICPQIFVNDSTKDIQVVPCGESLQAEKVEDLNNVSEIDTSTGSVLQNDTKKNQSVDTPPAVSNLSEFEQALAWMYANGLTKYTTEKDYRPDDALLREEAAKMFAKAYQVFGYNVKVMKNQQCEFSDEDQFNLELVGNIMDSCHWGLFKGTDDRKFLPKKALRKSEATAVLVRMLEGKLSYEKVNPWWTNYYQKAFLLWITTIDNINTYDKLQNRKEIALMLWRFKGIQENKNKDKRLKQLERSDTHSASGLKLDNWEADLNKVLGDIDFEKDPELIEAISWMHDEWLTKFSTIDKYLPSEVLTRVQAAKVFDIFSTALGREVNDGLLPNACVYSDITALSKEDLLHVQNVCKKGLMHGVDGKFSPDGEMLKSQFMVILVRLFDKNTVVSTKTGPWWQGYFQKARELWLVDISDVNTFDKPIRRYEVALFLYRFNVRYNIVNNINTNSVDKQLVTTIDKTKTTKDGKQQIDAYVDMSLFRLNDLDLAYLYVFDTRYKVVKTLRREYIDNAFVWYGDVFDLIDNKKLGTVNLIIRNNTLISGVMRIGEKNYVLEKKDWVDAYFTVIEQ